MKTPLLESLFNQVADFQVCNFIKKKLQHKCIPVNTAKVLRAFSILLNDFLELVGRQY